MTVFVDTNAFVAFADPRDQRHKKAKKEFSRLGRQRIHLITTNFVVDETLTLLLKKVGYQKTVKMGTILFAEPLTELIRLTATQERNAWDVFMQYNPDKYWSFTDCTSFVVMKRHQLDAVFTFDNHFSQMGFTVIPE